MLDSEQVPYMSRSAFKESAVLECNATDVYALITYTARQKLLSNDLVIKKLGEAFITLHV